MGGVGHLLSGEGNNISRVVANNLLGPRLHNRGEDRWYLDLLGRKDTVIHFCENYKTKISCENGFKKRGKISLSRKRFILFA